MLDPRVQRRHRLRNASQAVLIVGGMVAVLALLAWAFFGPVGLLVALGAAVVVLAFRPVPSPRLVLSMYRAREVPPWVLPELHRFVRVLAERGGLPAVPRLYYVASPMLNAFAVGRGDEAAIAVTDGLLRSLPGRELAGVLAHEVSHIRAGDLWIMNLSDVLGRVTHALAYGGLLAVLVSLPVTLGGDYPSLWLLALLGALPTVVSLLQLALSRSREYDADLEAAVLTGDPDGLADGLERLERATGRIWERVVVPHRRAPDPLLLRTHPATEERVRRLRRLVPRTDRDRLGGHAPLRPSAYRPVAAPVRLRFPGVRW
ncbi:zinc metalloprotease HtpX [Pseudonocardia humida]|uniref:M48 family metalloprotease n=1 Tax=Pseudonocardia humida TaxID=2800819 RepID=A0ABT0ZUW0_9PSEU|nr:zinc metalloprotease HtpX [Pseudonocardia humida]MCO1654516.1 M48 family metalloprotease [Pseudonocardia humida]